jgi:hypothetical protein
VDVTEYSITELLKRTVARSKSLAFFFEGEIKRIGMYQLDELMEVRK